MANLDDLSVDELDAINTDLKAQIHELRTERRRIAERRAYVVRVDAARRALRAAGFDTGDMDDAEIASLASRLGRRRGDVTVSPAPAVAALSGGEVA